MAIPPLSPLGGLGPRTTSRPGDRITVSCEAGISGDDSLAAGAADAIGRERRTRACRATVEGAVRHTDGTDSTLTTHGAEVGGYTNPDTQRHADAVGSVHV